MWIRSFDKLLMPGVVLLTIAGSAQAGSAVTGPQHPLPVAAAAKQPLTSPYKLALKDGQLDVGDERPVGEAMLMRGKENYFSNVRTDGGKPSTMVYDIAIMVTAIALLSLIVYAFRAQRRYVR